LPFFDKEIGKSFELILIGKIWRLVFRGKRKFAQNNCFNIAFGDLKKKKKKPFHEYSSSKRARVYTYSLRVGRKLCL
jgi:hypothetical protein